MRALLVSLALVLLSGCAALRGHDGTAADLATTGVGLSVGLAEANPAAVALLPVRLAMVEYAKTQPKEDEVRIIDASRAVGWGAAANNGVLIAAHLAGAVLSPFVAPVVGVITGAWLWRRGADEREFWQICAGWRVEHPDIVCTYTPPA